MARTAATILGLLAVLALPATARAAGNDLQIPAQDLHQIRAVLREFIPSAVARKDPGAAYRLAAPALRTGTTRDQWNQGSLPVVPYPARLSGYGIRPLEVSSDHVLFDLMLQPRAGAKAGAIIYKTEMTRVNGHWLVAAMTPAAQFSGGGAAPQVTAEPDLGPGRGNPGNSRLSQRWILVPMAVVALPLGATLIALTTIWLRGRRSRAGRTDPRASIPWRKLES